jgi:thiol:disulfide interchange protein DsbD
MPDPSHHRSLARSTWRHLLAATVGLAAAAPSVLAQPETTDERKNKVAFSLQLDGPATPGGTITLGLNYLIAKDWHTYWDGLNDTGMPASWKLTLPEGWEAGEPQWPAPKRYGMDNGVVDHVYFDEVTILIPVRIPATTEFKDFEIAASSKWLVCQEACIPERGESKTTVAVIDRPTPKQAPSGILASRARTIQTGWAELAAAKPETSLVDATLTVRVPGATKLAFFPGADSSPAEDLIEEGEATGDTLRVRMHQRKGEPLTVRGVIEVTRASASGSASTSWHALDFTPPSENKTETPAAAPAK